MTNETPMNETLVRELMRALEAGEHGDALARFFTDDAEQVEYPSAMRPAGGSRGVQALIDGSVAGAQMLAEQSYDVIEFIDGGDRAAVRLTWRATTATGVGGLPAGSTLTAHIAQFYEFRDGRISRQRSYDCYEPFGAASD